MGGRAVTNVLLAVIAGVLLFGRDAISSGLKGLAVVFVAVCVIWLVLLVAIGILSWIGSEWSAAKNTEERLSVVLGTAAGCILALLGAYALWLSIIGVERPVATAVQSWLGWAWVGVLLLLAGGYGIYGATKGICWLSEHGGEVPGIVGYRLRVFLWGYLEFLGGPVTFPIREWRIRSEAGAGTAVKLLSAAYVTVLGLIVALMTAGLTVGSVVGLLAGAGIID